MKAESTAKSEPGGSQPSEFENFSRALKQIVSVPKADLDLHEPIRPRKANGADKAGKPKS